MLLDLSELGCLLQSPAEVGAENADQNAEEERDSPTPRHERFGRKGRAEERGAQRTQQEARADADLLPGTDETAPSFLCVFHDIGGRSSPLAASGQPLQEPEEDE